MSEKRGKKKTNKNNKKVTKDKKSITLRVNDGSIVNASRVYEKSGETSRIRNLDTDKIEVFDK